MAMANLVMGGAGAKATCTQTLFKGLRCDVYKRVESLGYDPNPSDLGVGRLKRGESYVEDR